MLRSDLNLKNIKKKNRQKELEQYNIQLPIITDKILYFFKNISDYKISKEIISAGGLFDIFDRTNLLDESFNYKNCRKIFKILIQQNFKKVKIENNPTIFFRILESVPEFNILEFLDNIFKDKIKILRSELYDKLYESDYKLNKGNFYKLVDDVIGPAKKVNGLYYYYCPMVPKVLNSNS